MKLDEIINICNQYMEIMNEIKKPTHSNPNEIVEDCKKMKAFGYDEWEQPIIPYDFTIYKGNAYYLHNSATKYKFDPDKYYIHWSNGNIGRLQFTTEEYYCVVEEEWQEFKDIMLSYNPVDYDMLNCHIIYDIENGKKVMEDYKKICNEIGNKMNKKIKQIKIQKMEEQLKELKGESDG